MQNQSNIIHAVCPIKFNHCTIPWQEFEKLLNSEEYQYGISNRTYLVQYGNPDHSVIPQYNFVCMILKSMKLLDTDELDCEFEFVSTPTGRIVKAYIEQGVAWHISLWGVGIIDQSSKEVSSFIFRGFDFVLDM